MFKRALMLSVMVGMLAGCGTQPTGLSGAPKDVAQAQGLFSRIKAEDYGAASADQVRTLAQEQAKGKILGLSGKFKFSGVLSVSSKAGFLGDPRRAPMALVLTAQQQRIELLERRDTGFKAPDVYLYDKFNVGKKETVTALVTIEGGVLRLDGVQDPRGHVEKP